MWLFVSTDNSIPLFNSPLIFLFSLLLVLPTYLTPMLFPLLVFECILLRIKIRRSNDQHSILVGSWHV